MHRTYYFIRHALPINDAVPFQLRAFDQAQLGEQNQGLSNKGKLQAMAIQHIVQNYGTQCILSSTLKRAIETASILSEETQIPYLEQYEELIEFAPGITSLPLFTRLLVSLPLPKGIHARLDPSLRQILTFYYLFQWKRGKTMGGEALDHLYHRINYMMEVLDTYPQERIAIVGHGYWILFLALKLLKGPQREIFRWIHNCSITRVDADGKGHYRLIFFAKNYPVL